MKRKILILIVMVGMLFPAVTTNVFANNGDMDTWDGTADTTWYDDGETEFYLTTAEQLAGIAILVNDNAASKSFAGKTIYLDADVDLGGHDWLSIGVGNNISRNFAGVFDGQNHTIYNLSSKETKNHISGFFGVVSLGATIKNLGFIDAEVEVGLQVYSGHAGILAGWVNNSTVINCFSTGTVKSAHDLGEFRFVGGLIGQCTGSTKVIGSYSTASVEALDKGDGSDTVGGLIGQWETADAQSLISNCWFGGSIKNEYLDTATGGILGADFTFDDINGVNIDNCMIVTTDINCANPENFTWIASICDGQATNCYWPMDEDLETQYTAVVKMIVDWNAGTADPDPTFDQSVCGEAITDFKKPELLKMVQDNSSLNVTWVAGINHPVFTWDSRNILADYTKVNEAIEKIPGDLSKYTDESVAALMAAKEAVIYNHNVIEQTIVENYAKVIEDAITGLVVKKADYSKVDAAMAKIPKDLSIYTDKTVVALTTVKEAVIFDKDITEQSIVDGYAKAIEDAITALVVKKADYTKVNEAIAKIPGDLSIYTDKSVVTLMTAKNAVIFDKDITEQETVDKYAKDIEKAIAGLVEKAEISGKPNTTNTTNKPNTSDSSNIEIWSILLMVGLGSGIYLKDKKRRLDV